MRILCCGGGGSKGAHSVGVLRYLILDQNISYDGLCGVSVGALNTSFLSMFKKEDEKIGFQQLENFWLTLNDSKIYKKWFPFGRLHALWLKSMYNSDPLIKLMHSSLDINKIRSNNRKISVGAVSLTSGHYKSFTQEDDCFIDGVLASASFPAGLKPIKINDELFTDGGVQHISPLREAIDMGATEIDLILTSPPKTTSKYNNDSGCLKLALRTVDLMTDEIVSADLKLAQMYNKMALLDPSSGKKYVKINVYRPSEDLTDDSLNFNNELIKEMMSKGYLDAKTSKQL